MTGRALADFPIHLGRGGSAAVLPRFTGEMDWFEDYGARHPDDGIEGRLVSEYVFTGDWTSWECHPLGSEIVYCLAGMLTLHQEFEDGHVETVSLNAGDYAINPPGVWHTADIAGEARGLFITSGEGTMHRPR